MSRRAQATLADLAEIIRSLTQAGQHTQQRRIGWKYPNRTGPIYLPHTTDHESLLNQLREAVTDRSQTSHSQRFPGGTARTALPHFDADALDRLETIHHRTVEWTKQLGIESSSATIANRVHLHVVAIEQILHTALIGNIEAAGALERLRVVASMIRGLIEPDLRAIGVAAHSVPQDVLDELVSEVRDWRTWCRIMAGWHQPAMQPNVACPNCAAMPGERAGLRVRIDVASGSGGVVDNAAVKAAVCLSCDRTWDADTIGLLAAEITRQQQEREAQQREEEEQQEEDVHDGRSA